MVTAMSDMRLERLARKTGWIKPHLAVAIRVGQPHIGLRKDGLPIQHSSAGTALPVSEVLSWHGPCCLSRVCWKIGWAIGLKYTEGFTRLVPSRADPRGMAGSILLLGLALKTLPIGTAYAVWTGIGAVGTAILGIALVGDPATAVRLALHRTDRCRHRRPQAASPDQRSSSAAQQVSAATMRGRRDGDRPRRRRSNSPHSSAPPRRAAPRRRRRWRR